MQDIAELKNTILCGDVLEKIKLIPDESINLVCTSPPYWGLRDYGTATWDGGSLECDHKDGACQDDRVKGRDTNIYLDECKKCGARRVDEQWGLESHPQQWVDKMVGLCRELRRVLRDDGVMYFNVGETYYGSGGAGGDYDAGGLKDGQPMWKQNSKEKSNWLRPKQLLGLPWRFAIAMQNDGWLLRNAIIWNKSNAMPQSVTDRFANKYEYVFMFVKQGKYWFDLDAVRIPYETFENRPMGLGEPQLNPAGKSPGDVWQINTRPHPFAHFAVMAEELVERCILSGCPKGGVVLDPFFGSGTVGVVAKRLGRSWVGVELSERYCRLARARLDGFVLWGEWGKVESGEQKLLFPV